METEYKQRYTIGRLAEEAPALFRAEQAAAPDRLRPFPGAASDTFRLSCLFGAFVFLQFTVLGLANHAGEGYLGTAQREVVYYALQVFVILGYLLHVLFMRVCAGRRVRRMAAYGVFGLFFVCVSLMLMAGTASRLSVIVSMTAALCLGGIGGAAHSSMSRESLRGSPVARGMGLGSACAVMLQYLLQIRRGVTPLLPPVMGGCLILLLLLLRREQEEEYPAEEGKPERTTPRRLLFSALIAASFILFTCFYNETIHHRMIRSAYASGNVYSWPRLMLIPGYLLFALIGDRKGGKWVPIVSLCIMLTALLNVVLTGEESDGWFNMCLFYFSIAAFSSYYLLSFWRLAPGTGHPAFWAPFGRMLDSGMVLLTGAIRLSTLPASVMLGVDIAGVALVILLMAAGGDLSLFTAVSTVSSGLPETDRTVQSTAPETSFDEEEDLQVVPETAAVASEVTAAAPEMLSLLSPEETLDKMRDHYALTPREADVLRELVLTEDTQAAIADRLCIQVKTLQTYVTRLYRKTGASTRAGLTDLYHECRNG